MTTQPEPEPYTYTDPTDPFGHTLAVGPVDASTYDGTIPVVSFGIQVPEDALDPENPVVYVPLPDVERVVAAIRTAAGQHIARSLPAGGDQDCDRCDGTGLDPDRYTEQQQPDGSVWYHAEPCAECRTEEPAAGQPEPATDRAALDLTAEEARDLADAADRDALRERIAEALHESCMTEAEAVGPMADAVLSEAGWGPLVSEASRLRRATAALEVRAEEIESRVAALRDQVAGDQAAEEKSLGSGLTDEDQAAVDSLRRMATEEPDGRDRAAIASVRALHVPDENGECRECFSSLDPCPTIAAIDGARRMADEAQPAETPAAGPDDLPARLEAALTERYTELGNPFSEMRQHEKGPDGWPASHPVGPRHVAEVLRELISAETQPKESDHA